MSRWYVTVLLLVFGVLAPSAAFAADTWTDVAPGVRQLVRTAPGPLRYVAVTVDLNRSEYHIRATRPNERGQTVTGWANQVDAVVAINGDFFSAGYQPVGLAVGDGVHWPGTDDVAWSFMACTIENTCVFDDFTTDQALYHRWHEVVGGNGWRLLTNGNIPDYPDDGYYEQRHPRSGVGTSADGKTMIFAAVEGRRGDSIGTGYVQFAQFFKDLGGHNALMLDGGGSTALTVNGTRVSRLPSAQGSERVVANHIGILRSSPDARCAQTPNGRYCEGNVIHTCRGGGYQGSGDCAAFGASCEVTSDGIGVCVHPFCTGGANGSYCEDENIITTCDYGAPGGSGDCSVYGATCETGQDNSYCVHYLCTEGGNASWCKDDGTLATCVNGQPEDDVDCTAGGQVCREGACVDPDNDTPDDSDPTDDPGDMNGDPGPDAGTEDVDDQDDTDSGETATETGQESADAGGEGSRDTIRDVTGDGSAGCAVGATGEPGSGWMLVCFLALMGAFRGRGSRASRSTSR